MSTSLCNLSNTSSSTINSMEIRERDETNENFYFKTMTYLPSRALFDSDSCHYSCARSLQISGTHYEDDHGYLQCPSLIFTVNFPFQLQSFLGQAIINKTHLNRKHHKLVTTYSTRTASDTTRTAQDTTRTAQVTNEELMQFQQLAGLQIKRLHPGNLYNRCIGQPSHDMMQHRNRNSKTFSIQTHKRLTRLRRQYNRYLMSRKCVNCFAHKCLTYHLEIDYRNVSLNECFRQYLKSDKYKVPNNKRVTKKKTGGIIRDSDITVLYVGSAPRSESLEPCEYTPAVRVPTDCDPNECYQVKKGTPYGWHASTQTGKYKINKKYVTTKKLPKQRDLDIHLIYDGSKSKSKSLKPFQCSFGISVPTNCDPNNCCQRFKKNVEYGCNAPNRSGKNILPNEKQEIIKKSTVKCYRETAAHAYSRTQFNSSSIDVSTNCDPNESLPHVKKYAPCGCYASTQSSKYKMINEKRETVNNSPAKRYLDTAVPEVASRSKHNSMQPGVGVRTNCDPNQCFQRVKKLTPYGCHALTQSSKYKMMNEKRDTVEKSSEKRCLDTSVPSVPAKSKRDAMQPDVGINTNCDPNECFRQTKKYKAYGNHASTQSSKYTIQEQQSPRIEPYGGNLEEINKKQKTKKLKPFECEPGTCALGAPKHSQQAKRFTKQKSKKKQQCELEPIPCKRNTCQRLQRELKRIYCKPKDCVSRKCELKNCHQRLQPTRLDIINAYNTSRTSQSSTQTLKVKPRILRSNRKVVRIGSTCSFDVEFYKCITRNCTDVQQNYVCTLNPHECKPCYQQLTSDTSSNATSQANKKKERNVMLTPTRPVVCYRSNGSCVPQNVFVMNITARSQKQQVINAFECNPGIPDPDISDPAACVQHALQQFYCEHGVCGPAKCDPGKCFQKMKVSGADDSHTSISKTHVKNRRPKIPLHIPNMPVDSTGSKCSFNFEYYKSLPQNWIEVSEHINESAKYDQGDTPVRLTSRYKKKRQECKYDICDPGKFDPGTCAEDAIERFDCELRVGMPDKCDPNKCHQRLNVTGTDTDSNASRGSQASMLQISMNKIRSLKKENSILYKAKRSFSILRPKIALHIFNTQVVYVGSKFGLNIDLYKGLSENGFMRSYHMNKPANYDQDKTLIRNKSKPQKRQVLNPFECKPGICNPSACVQQDIEPFDCQPGVCATSRSDSSKCFQRITVTNTNTDSNASSRGSQAFILPKRINKRLLVKKENTILYRDQGLFSMPRPKMTLQIFNTEVVRIGSKCSFNVEFYKGLPQNGFGMSDRIDEPTNPDQVNTPAQRDKKQDKKTSSRKTRQVNPFECKPGICVPGKCDPSACVQQAIEQFECERGVCVPGKCAPSKCFERIKNSSTDTESVGSQASRRMKKERLLKEKNAVLYKEKGSSSMPRSKMPLHIPNRKAVRIGSKCSFNVEFYKCLPQNGFAMSENINQPANTFTEHKIGNSKKKRKEGNPFECRPGICKPGKCDPATCALQTLKRFNCEPGVCVPGKCDPSKCFQRIKVSGADTDSNTASQGSQASMSQKRMKKARLINEKNVILYKDKGVLSMPKANKPNQQAVRIGSTLSFNVEFYKSLPPNGILTSEHSNESANYDKEDSPTRDKASGQKKKRVLKPYECDPGVCVPGKCNLTDCFQRLKASGTDTNVTSRGSQASSKAGRKKKPKMPLHKPYTVRIDSGLKLNAELFKSLPPNGAVTSEHSNEPAMYDQGDLPTRHKASSRKKNRISKPYECQPGVCAPGKCNVADCVQRLKTSGTDTNTSLKADYNLTSHGSLASSEAGRRRKKGDLPQGNWIMSRPTMPTHKPKHSVRIGSTLSFNVECYKSLPPKVVTTNENMNTPTRPDEANPLLCKPGICIPGECDPDLCFQQLSSVTTDSYATSRVSQARTDRKKKGSKQNKKNGIRYKDKGACACCSMRVPKMRVPRKHLHIGSKCSFNIEFFKTLPQNNFVKNIPAKFDQGDTPGRKKGQVLNPFECKPGICVPGKCDPGVCAKYRLTGFECQPGVCVPGKCDVAKCFQQLNRSSTDSSSSGKKKQYECEPGVCVPGKCDPNSCLLHALNGFECLPGVCIPGKCDVAKCIQLLKSNSTGTSKKKKSKLTKLFECEPGVCTPGKCDPYECLARLKILHGASAFSEDGQAFTQTMKGKKISRKNIAGKETLYKEKGASTIPRNKMPLHMPNRDVVRIGSICSFNVEFYKEKPNNLKALSQMECEPSVCIPKKCDPIDCYQRLQNADMGTKRKVKGTKRKVKRSKSTDKETKREVKRTKSTDEETKHEVKRTKSTDEKTKREVKRTKSTDKETKHEVKKTKSTDEETKSTDEETKSEYEGPKREVKKTKSGIQKSKRRVAKVEKPKRGFEETTPLQSVDSDRESSSPSEYETSETQSKASRDTQAKQKKKGIISLVKKCCTCKMKRKRKQGQKQKSKLGAEYSEEDVTNTSPRVDTPMKSYGANAGTQSRKYPTREMMPKIKPPVKRDICDCGAKILPSLADRIYCCIGRMLRQNTKEEDYDIFVIQPNDCGTGDINDYCREDTEERGVVIDSCGGFNLKLTRNNTKIKNC